MKCLPRIIIALVLLMTAQHGAAQVPGYQGKKVVMRYDFGIFWDFFDEVDPRPVMAHKANAEFVLSEAHVLGVRYHFSRPRVLAGDHFLKPIPDREKVGELTNHNTVFFAKIYRFRKAGHIAPVGQYWLVGATFSAYQYQGITDVLNLEEIQGKTGYGVDLSILAGTGKTFVVKDRLVIDLGFEFNIPVSGWRHNPLGGPIGKSDAGVFTRQFNIFQVNLGIGALVF
jgi:hypothetical protein